MGYIEDLAGLSGKAAIVIGGGGGLGRPCTLALARAGVDVAIADRDPEATEETRRLAEAAGVKVHIRLMDARKPEELEALFAEVDQVFDNRLDVLVNVVGGSFMAPFMETSPNAWDAIIRTNFTYLIRATYLAAKRMRETGGGSIISISSVEGQRGCPGRTIYSAMKSAVDSFSRSLAVELARDNIRLNSLAPDIFRVDADVMNDRTRPDADPADHLSVDTTIPMGRYGTPEDIAGPLLYFASGLSRYVTGQTHQVDGGTMSAGGWFNWPGVWFDNMIPEGVAKMMVASNTAAP